MNEHSIPKIGRKKLLLIFRIIFCDINYVKSFGSGFIPFVVSLTKAVAADMFKSYRVRIIYS